MIPRRLALTLLAFLCFPSLGYAQSQLDRNACTQQTQGKCGLPLLFPDPNGKMIWSGTQAEASNNNLNEVQLFDNSSGVSQWGVNPFEWVEEIQHVPGVAAVQPVLESVRDRCPVPGYAFWPYGQTSTSIGHECPVQVGDGLALIQDEAVGDYNFLSGVFNNPTENNMLWQEDNSCLLDDNVAFSGTITTGQSVGLTFTSPAPATTTVSYTVQGGDTLQSISEEEFINLYTNSTLQAAGFRFFPWARMQITGTVTPGDVITLTLTPPVGSPIVIAYTVNAKDTTQYQLSQSLAEAIAINIGNGLTDIYATGINGGTGIGNLDLVQAYGCTSAQAGVTPPLYCDSQNGSPGTPTMSYVGWTFASSLSGGATETLAWSYGIEYRGGYTGSGGIGTQAINLAYPLPPTSGSGWTFGASGSGVATTTIRTGTITYPVSKDTPSEVSIGVHVPGNAANLNLLYGLSMNCTGTIQAPEGISVGGAGLPLLPLSDASDNVTANNLTVNGNPTFVVPLHGGAAGQGEYGAYPLVDGSYIDRLPYGIDWSQPGWSTSSTTQANYSANADPFGGTKSNLITNTAIGGYISQATTVADDALTHSLGVYWYAPGSTGLHPEIALSYSGGTAVVTSGIFTYATGATGGICTNSATPGFLSCAGTTTFIVTPVNGLNNWYHMCLTAPNNHTGNTTLTAKFYPDKASLGSASAAAVFYSADLYDGATCGQNIPNPTSGSVLKNPGISMQTFPNNGILGDATAAGTVTLTCGLSKQAEYLNGSLTGNVTVSLDTTKAFPGCDFIITNAATLNAHTVTANSIGLTAKQWVDERYDGASWDEIAGGTAP